MKFDRKESHKSGWDVMQDKVFSLYKDRGQEPLRKALVVFCGDTAVDGVNKTQGRLSFNEAAVISQGYGPVNAAARRINAPVYLIDIGYRKIPRQFPAYSIRRLFMVRIMGTRLWIRKRQNVRFPPVWLWPRR